MAVGEYHREAVAIGSAVGVGDGPAVHVELALLRSIQPAKDLDESALAAAIASNDEHELSGAEAKIERAEREALLSGIAVVVEQDIAHLEERLSGSGQCGRGRRLDLRCGGDEEAQLLDVLQGHLAPRHGRQGADR